MPKTLVVVESPAKAKTIEKYLGGDYTVRASYGHIRDLPKSQLGVDVEHDFEPDYMVPEDSERHVGGAEVRPQEGRRPRPGHGLRPRGRGHRVPRGHASWGSPRRREARDVHRDHEGRHPRSVPRAARDRHEARRCAAGPPRPRPAGRLPDLAAALEARPSRAVGRPGAIRRRSPDRRTRTRDPGVQPDRVLERRRPAHARRRPAAVPGSPGRGPTASSRPHRTRRACSWAPRPTPPSTSSA